MEADGTFELLPKKEVIKLNLEREKLEKFIEFTLDASRDIKKTPKYDTIREEMQEEIYQMQKQLAALRDLQRNPLVRLQFHKIDKDTGSVVLQRSAGNGTTVQLVWVQPMQD